MALFPHVAVNVSDMEASQRFYEGLDFAVRDYGYIPSIGARVAMVFKAGFPPIELVEHKEGGVKLGFDHVTATNPLCQVGRPIPELGIRTEMFYGPDGEKLEAISYK